MAVTEKSSQNQGECTDNTYWGENNFLEYFSWKKFFCTQTDDKDEIKEQALERKEQTRKKATEWVANEEPYSMNPSFEEITRIDGNKTLFSMNGIQANANTSKKDTDVVLKKWNSKYLANHKMKWY